MADDTAFLGNLSLFVLASDGDSYNAEIKLQLLFFQRLQVLLCKQHSDFHLPASGAELFYYKVLCKFKL